jgi:TonB family protein
MTTRNEPASGGIYRTLLALVLLVFAAQSSFAQLTGFAGTWRNVDATSRGIVQLDVSDEDGLRLHVWGACSPAPCDWGTAPAYAYGSDVSARATQASAIASTFSSPFAEKVVLLTLAEPARLRAEVYTRFTDQSGRAAFHAAELFIRPDAARPTSAESRPPATAGPSQGTLSSRSAHHDVRVERNALSPELIRYDVNVTDLDSGAVILKSYATGGAREPVDVSAISGDQKVHVHLAYTPSFFSATLAVTRGETILDEFRTWWQLEPRAQNTPADAQAQPSTAASGAYRVGGDVKAPRLVHRVTPLYSEAARRDRISGIVIAEAVVGKDGRVKDAIVLKGLPDGLSEAALAAIKQWEFEPGTRNGEPVDVIFNLTTNFKLDTTPAPAQ